MGRYPLSLLQNRRECYVCREMCFKRTVDGLHRHHVYPGSRRAASEKYGCTVWLCESHHTGHAGVHHSRTLSLWIMNRMQKAFEARYGHEKFMEAFGKDFSAMKLKDIEEELYGE